MLSTNEIENRIKSKIIVSYVKAVDLRGGDHIQLILVSPDFEAKSLISRHKIVYDALAEELKSNEIHALTLKTYTPNEWENGGKK